jgi:hypothetical protein
MQCWVVCALRTIAAADGFLTRVVQRISSCSIRCQASDTKPLGSLWLISDEGRTAAILPAYTDIHPTPSAAAVPSRSIEATDCAHITFRAARWTSVRGWRWAVSGSGDDAGPGRILGIDF